MIGRLFCCYTPMHEVTPKVVAMAVSTVITMFRILLQISLFIYFERLRVKGDGVRFFTTDYTDFHGLYLYSIRME